MDQGSKTAFSSASRPMKLALSFAVFYCSFTLGIFMTTLGPAVNDFVLKFDSDVSTVSKVFTVQLVAYLVGALVGGIVYNFVNRQIAVMFLLATAASALFIVPHVTTLTTLYVMGGLIGFSGGGFDTAQVAWIIDIWRHEAGPYILSQHFAYSLGTLVPPLTLAPFLTGDLPETTTTPASLLQDSTEVLSTTELTPSADLFIPFTIAGGFVVLAVIVQIVLFFVFQRMKDPEALNNNVEDERKSENVVTEMTDQGKSLLRRKIMVVFLSCCFIGFYQAMELCTFQFLPTFANYSEVHLSDKDAARVLFGLTVGFAVGRAIGIATVLKIQPYYILGVNFVLVLAGNTLLLVLGGSQLTWLWIGSICFGLGFSTMYPAFYAYLEKYLFVDDTIAAIITVSGGTVSAIYPEVVGGAVETNPRILNYVDYASFVVCLLAFVALYRLTHRRVDPKDVEHKD